MSTKKDQAEKPVEYPHSEVDVTNERVTLAPVDVAAMNRCVDVCERFAKRIEDREATRLELTGELSDSDVRKRALARMALEESEFQQYGYSADGSPRDPLERQIWNAKKQYADLDGTATVGVQLALALCSDALAGDGRRMIPDFPISVNVGPLPAPTEPGRIYVSVVQDKGQSRPTRWEAVVQMAIDTDQDYRDLDILGLHRLTEPKDLLLLEHVRWESRTQSHGQVRRTIISAGSGHPVCYDKGATARRELKRLEEQSRQTRQVTTPNGDVHVLPVLPHRPGDGSVGGHGYLTVPKLGGAE